MSYVLILIVKPQIWKIIGLLKTQKLEYLENEIDKFLICASDGRKQTSDNKLNMKVNTKKIPDACALTLKNQYR